LISETSVGGAHGTYPVYERYVLKLLGIERLQS